MSSPPRTKALLLAVTVLAIGGAFQTYSARSICPQPDAYGFARTKSRIGDLDRNIPSAEIVGYLSDLPTTEHKGGMALQAVQYSLAPRMVVDLKDHPNARWVIGNFNQPGDFAGEGAARGLRLVEDLGNGIVLYQRVRP